MVTVRGSAESVESRLLAGKLRCPCGGVLGPWGHARCRRVAMPGGWEEFRPRRSRCRACGRTHVLLPADLWSRRRYGAAVILAVLVLAAQAAAAGRAAARPWLRVPGRRRQVPASTARSWRSRFSSRASVLREQLAGLLPRVSQEEAARPLAAAGSAAGDCLAVLEAVTRGLRDSLGMAGLAPHEAAAHLSGALWLAPAVPVLRFNTTLLTAAANVPS
ncbi:MAG TPA: DUF6431 domain-containing protein [Streptosporangiaceae bacterium]|nr:DUF6431 domain-containing protein [Streptosporangiaceae bacterium]